MILPVVLYGNPILRVKCSQITNDYPQLSTLIDNMWETMYNSNGVGIAAPQINLPIRLFVVDTLQLKDIPNGIKQVFINPTIISYSEQTNSHNEGCLSLPGISESIRRSDKITINYFDENFVEKTEEFSTLNARVIQHEYDHIEGKLFIDYLSALSKKLLKGRLTDIQSGKIKTKYKTKK